MCPTEREAKFELFPLTCNKNHDCAQALGKNFRCCKLFGGQRCHEGLEVPLADIDHERELKTFQNFILNLVIFYLIHSTFWNSKKVSKGAASRKLLGRQKMPHRQRL